MQVSHGDSLRTERPPQALRLGVNPPRPTHPGRGANRASRAEKVDARLSSVCAYTQQASTCIDRGLKDVGELRPHFPDTPGVRTDPDCPGPSWHS